MTEKHTPGPWHVGKIRVDGRTRSVAIHPAATVTSFGREDTRLEANARLIAAAPDMLAAPRAILAEAKAADGPLPVHAFAWDMLHAAIAKAEAA